MHQIFATLLSLLVALCHHTSLTAHPVEAAELPAVVQTTSTTENPSMILPDRYALARYTTADGGYADAACSSCRQTGLSYSNR